MQITKTLHPPGGATALIAIIGSDKTKTLGYIYIVSPVLIGVLILLLTALIFNNTQKKEVIQTTTGYMKNIIFSEKGLLQNNNDLILLHYKFY